MANTLPKLIVIVGSTASGKTALGIEIAKRVGGEVISADSRLVFRGMDIGTAKPLRDTVVPPPVILSDSEGSPEIMRDSSPLAQNDKGKKYRSIYDLFREKPYMVEGVPHWGIDLANPDEDYNVSQFKTYAEARIKEIISRGHVPILVGGTGLWVDAVADNLSIPKVPPNQAIRAELEARSLDDLFAQYKRLDPDGAEQIDRHNKRRLMRALEVCRVTGKPFSVQQAKGNPKYDVLKIGIEVSKDVLNGRIEQRVDEMIAKGLVNEVRSLLTRFPPENTAMTGIGYRQIVNFLEGKTSLASTIEDVKRDTRAYAKRQATWFKRDPRIKWVKNSKEVIELVETYFRSQ